MSVEFKEERTDIGAMLEELRSRIKTLTPSSDALIRAAYRMPGAEGGLSRRELNSLVRGLERVWHIMRLLHLLAEYFDDSMFFGGGAILNYVYMIKYKEPPRLTFDLDSSWYKTVRSKRVILSKMVEFNKWLAENDLILMIPTGGGRVRKLFLVEYDTEKDHFPTLLSLRMPVITRYDGEPFYRFLGIKDYRMITRLRRLFKETLGVENAKIDYVRFEVGLNPEGMHRVEVVLEDLFGWKSKAWITNVEYQLASKIKYKIAKDFGEDLIYNIHDILKAVLDLRLLDYVDVKDVMKYAKSIDDRIVDHNLNATITYGKKLWERNYHYILVRRRYTLTDIIKRVRKNLGCSPC